MTPSPDNRESPGKRLNVLLVHVWFWPHLGGGDKHVEALGSELVRRGHRVTVWCGDLPEYRPRYIRAGMRVRRFQPLAVLGGVDPVVNTFREDISEFDVVHVHDVLPVIVRQALWRAKSGRKPLVVTYHNDYVKETALGRFVKRARWELQARPLFRLAAARLALTPWWKSVLQKRGIQERIDVVPNGIDPGEFDGEGSLPPGLPDGPYLLFLGRMHRQKAVDVMLGAFDDYCESSGDNETRLVLAGEGPLHAEMIQYADGLTHRDRIHFIGRVEDRERVGLYRNAEAILMSSVWEGLPTVLLESMVCSRPVVMTDVSGMGDLVRRLRCGVVSSGTDRESFSAAIEDLMSRTSEERDEMGRRGKGGVGPYEWTSIVDTIEGIYRRVTG